MSICTHNFMMNPELDRQLLTGRVGEVEHLENLGSNTDSEDIDQIWMMMNSISPLLKKITPYNVY